MSVAQWIRETEHDDQDSRPSTETFTSPWTTQTALTTSQKRGTGALRHCLVRTIRPSGHASSCCRRQMLPRQPASSWNTQMEDDADGSRCNDGCTVSAWSTTMNNDSFNSPFAHGGLFWPGCQICNVCVGSVWYYAKCFNNIVVKSVCYRTVKPWWIYLKVGIFYNYFFKPTLCETATETDSSARMRRSLDGRVVIEITHAGAACNRLSVERQ